MQYPTPPPWPVRRLSLLALVSLELLLVGCSGESTPPLDPVAVISAVSAPIMSPVRSGLMGAASAATLPPSASLVSVRPEPPTAGVATSGAAGPVAAAVAPGDVPRQAALTAGDAGVLGQPALDRPEGLDTSEGRSPVASTTTSPCGATGWSPRRPTTAPLTDRFGWSAWRGRNHDGLDFGTAVGTAVHAVEAGRVVRSQWDGAYGNVVFVEHDNGYLSTYNHLSARMVEVGQEVCKGDLLARSGDTGAGTGPHLHFEIWVPGNCRYPGVGARCPKDPLTWL